MRSELRSAMDSQVGVYRTGTELEAALSKIRELKQRLPDIRVKDRGRIYNTDLLSAIERENVLDLAEVVVAGWLAIEPNAPAVVDRSGSQDQWLALEARGHFNVSRKPESPDAQGGDLER